MKSATNTDLNLKRIIKPLQEIADEIDLKPLLKKSMKIVLENADAKRGCIILEKNGQWFIEAEGAIDKDEVIVLQSIPIAESSISKNIIDHVIRTNDLYIVKHQIKSVLCMPLLTQNKLIGLLYFDNKMTHIFTQDKLAALKLLSSQIAMSIRNACNKEKKDINIKYQK